MPGPVTRTENTYNSGFALDILAQKIFLQITIIEWDLCSTRGRKKGKNRKA